MKEIELLLMLTIHEETPLFSSAERENNVISVNYDADLCSGPHMHSKLPIEFKHSAFSLHEFSLIRF